MDLKINKKAFAVLIQEKGILYNKKSKLPRASLQKVLKHAQRAQNNLFPLFLTIIAEYVWKLDPNEPLMEFMELEEFFKAE